MDRLSIIVPCFNEESTIPIFYKTVEKIIKQINAEVEYCFVDDGSKDKTFSILRDLSKESESVHYISFSRNFGARKQLCTQDLRWRRGIM